MTTFKFMRTNCGMQRYQYFGIVILTPWTGMVATLRIRCILNIVYFLEAVGKKRISQFTGSTTYIHIRH